MGDTEPEVPTQDDAPSSSAAARPEASRRDPEQTREALERWLAATLPAGSEPLVESVTVPESNGMSSETLLFTASWTADGAARAERYVARIRPEMGEDFVPEVKEFVGAATFLPMARDADVSLFI